MKPLAVGVAGGAILAGPPLWALYQADGITGTGAITRGLIVVAVCTVAATFLDGIIRDYERDAVKRENGEIVAAHQGPPGPGQSPHQQPGQPGQPPPS